LGADSLTDLAAVTARTLDANDSDADARTISSPSQDTTDEFKKENSVAAQGTRSRRRRPDNG
jgi:hypothetical protein